MVIIGADHFDAVQAAARAAGGGERGHDFAVEAYPSTAAQLAYDFGRERAATRTDTRSGGADD